MENDVLVLFLNNGITLISKVEEVFTDLGEPDCKLVNPFVINVQTNEMTRWLEEYTDNHDEIMISSDKILTLVEPKQKLLDEYLEKTK